MRQFFRHATEIDPLLRVRLGKGDDPAMVAGEEADAKASTLILD